LPPRQEKQISPGTIRRQDFSAAIVTFNFTAQAFLITYTYTNCFSSMQIIPALSIKDGKAADFRPDSREIIFLQESDPYKIIDLLSDNDIRRIHLVDIDGAERQGKDNVGLIGSLSNVCVSDIEVGGGITDVDHLKSLQYAGVDYFVLGSAVYDHPELLQEISEIPHIQNDDIMIGVDLVDGKLSYHGYREHVPDDKIHHVIQRCLEMGFRRILVTDIDHQAPEQGPTVGFYADLIRDFPQLRFTAAGHIRSFADVNRLKEAGVVEAVVGYDFYRDADRLKRLAEYNAKEDNEE